MGLKRFIIRRLMQIAVVFFVIMTVLFVLFRLAPGDPVERMVDPSMTPEDAQLLKESMGLDQPVWTQYLYYLKNVATGNMGVSFHYGEPVMRIVMNRLPNTVLLFTTSIILSAFLGIFLGKIAAWKRGERTDTLMTIGALFCHTLFLPWLALIMIWFFAYRVGWFPITGMVSPEVWIDPRAGFMDKALDVLHHMALPLMTLILIHFGSYLLVMRSSMLDTLKNDYIVTARAKGLDENAVLYRHVFRNAMLLIIAGMPAALIGIFFTGSMLIEVIFSLDGLGLLGYEAVINRDYPVIFGTLYIFTLVGLLLKLVSDITYTLVDPRIDFASREV